MLSAMNYTVWAIRMKVILNVHQVWDVVDQGTDDPKRNNIAIAVLFQAIPEDLILQVGTMEKVKEIWDAIKTRHLGADRVREARLQTLTAEFENLKMKETSTIDEFVSQLSSIVSKSSSLGGTLDETKLVKKFLTSLPRRFIHIVASIEHIVDLKTVGFEDVVGRLKAYEERIRDDVPNNDQGKLLFNKSVADTTSRGSSTSRGGRGGRGYSGSGRGRGGRSNYTYQPHSPVTTKTESEKRAKIRIDPRYSAIVVTSLATLRLYAQIVKQNKSKPT